MDTYRKEAFVKSLKAHSEKVQATLARHPSEMPDEYSARIKPFADALNRHSEGVELTVAEVDHYMVEHRGTSLTNLESQLVHAIVSVLLRSNRPKPEDFAVKPKADIAPPEAPTISLKL